MGGKIFINYRRNDDPGFTQALYQRLEDDFASEDLFMDVEGQIRPGDDFVEVLNAKVSAADVMLVVIGPRWADLFAAHQGGRDDFVVIEIKAALDRGKRVIPVLVGGADMPRVDALPEGIRPLVRRNAVGLRPERFRGDCQGLVTALKESLAAAEKERAARTEAERKAAEAARREAEAQAAARVNAAEARGRVQAAAGLSAEEIRKAEELASWDFVKDRNDIQDLRDHLARFPAGTTDRYALAKLDGLVWAGLGSTPAIDQLRTYLSEFPKGAHAGAAQARIAALESEAAEARAAEQQRAQETAEWGAVAASADRAAIEAFVKQWPNGQHTAAARARIAELRRGAGGLRRGILLGAVATGALAALIVGGWIVYQRARLLPMFWDVSTSALPAQTEQALKPGGTFKECASCPEMVVVPAGSFMMGSPEKELGRYGDEGPQRRVTIATPFAIGKFEITFDEWDACVAHSGCKQEPDDSSWGRGKRPVINVSWNEAKEYVAWVAKLTGKPYRLLSEAEWEYAARAGNPGRFSFGDDEAKLGEYAWYVSNSKTTQPVGTKKANAFGLHDMHGNVWEWVEDCYKDSYKGVPTNGSAWLTGDCDRRVVRGGSWVSSPQYLRSAFRFRLTAVVRNSIVGFRVGRTLTP
jgi:formylglycine-generating enzyme required for sulfatase activity